MLTVRFSRKALVVELPPRSSAASQSTLALDAIGSADLWWPGWDFSVASVFGMVVMLVALQHGWLVSCRDTEHLTVNSTSLQVYIMMKLNWSCLFNIGLCSLFFSSVLCFLLLFCCPQPVCCFAWWGACVFSVFSSPMQDQIFFMVSPVLCYEIFYVAVSSCCSIGRSRRYFQSNVT